MRSGYKVPKFLESCDSLPKSNVGKILVAGIGSEGLRLKGEKMIPAIFSRKNTVLSMFLVISMTLMMAGCTSGQEAQSPPSATSVVHTVSPTSRPTETQVSTNTPVPTDTRTPFVPKATIKIFSQGPLSGDLSPGGRDVMRGAKLAVERLADPLMDLGYKIELVPYDDQNDMGKAVAVAKEIVSDPDIFCGVGPYASRILNQVKEIYHQEGMAFVSPSSTAAFATASGYLEVNRVVGRHDAQGAVGAQFAKAQGFSRVFIMSQGTDYAQFNSYHFREEANRIGVEVVGNMTTDATNTFGKIIERIIKANTDVVYFSTLNLEQAGTFFREARAAGYMGAFLGNEGIDNPALLDFAGPLLVEGSGMYYTSIGAPASSYPGATGFLENFETLYDVTPQVFAAQAYDAAGICMRAIEEASKTKGGEIPTRAEVANAIRALHDYQGITGVYNFNKNGDPDPAQYFIFQIISPNPDDWNQNILITSFEIAPPY